LWQKLGKPGIAHCCTETGPFRRYAGKTAQLAAELKAFPLHGTKAAAASGCGIVAKKERNGFTFWPNSLVRR
jgi:hypothetical protein